MTSRLFAFVVSPLLSATALAGSVVMEAKETVVVQEPCPPVALDWLTIRGSYTGESDFERGDDARGSSSFTSVELNHRIPLNLFNNWPNVNCGQWYLRVGAEYSRWNFDNEGGLPIPNTLQNFNAIIALEYLIQEAIAISIEARPGFYFEHDVRGDSFNVPVIAYAPLWWHEGENVSWALVGGVLVDAFDSTPVLPVGGLTLTYGKWNLFAVMPRPRLIYTPNQELSLWVGGELAAGDYRTDDQDNKRQENLNHALVEYKEWRAGAGFTWRPSANALIDLGAGYVFHREFEYHRADETFESDGGSPFVRLEFRATF